MESTLSFRSLLLATVGVGTLFTSAFGFAPSHRPLVKSQHTILSFQSQKKESKWIETKSSLVEVNNAQVKRLPVFVGWMHQDVDRVHSFNEFAQTIRTELVPIEDETPSQLVVSHPDSTSNESKEVWIARLLLLLSAALYGTNFTFVKSLDESLSVGLSSTLRFGFAALFMLPWLLAPIDEELKAMAQEKLQKCRNEFDVMNWEMPTRLTAGLAGMEIGMYNAIGYISQAVGLKTIPANKSAFICSMAVVTVPILDYMFGKRLLKRQVLGAVLAAIGVWALEMGGEQGASLSSGDLISLVQPVMFGLGFWRMEAAMEKYPTEAGRLAAAQLLMVFLVSLSYLICRAPMADACEAIPTVSELMVWLRDPYVLGMLLWTGIVTTAFTIWMETLALKTLSAAETTLIFSTEPLFGAAFSAIVANECFGNEAAIGAAFIIGGCLVSGLDLSKKIKGLSLLKWNMKKIGFQ